MRIIIFGAAGQVGSRMVVEALSRGHDVTAVVRKPDQFVSLPSAAKAHAGDARDPDAVAAMTADHDLVISAVRPPTGKDHQLIKITQAILNGAARSGIRVLVVGGAASLKVPGPINHTVLTAPNFLPVAVVEIARACFAQHEMMMANTEADWTLLCPPAMLEPGIRTGQYRLGRDELLIDSDGKSAISMEDFAAVLLDEGEQPQHQRVRFTAAY